MAHRLTQLRLSAKKKSEWGLTNNHRCIFTLCRQGKCPGWDFHQPARAAKFGFFWVKPHKLLSANSYSLGHCWWILCLQFGVEFQAPGTFQEVRSDGARTSNRTCSSFSAPFHPDTGLSEDRGFCCLCSKAYGNGWDWFVVLLLTWN